MTFFYLLNSPVWLIVYTHAKKKSDLIHYVRDYIANKKTNVKLVLIYSCDEGMLEFESNVIHFHYCRCNFEQLLTLHNYSKDVLAKSYFNKQNFLRLYDNIALTVDEINQRLINSNRKPNGNIDWGMHLTKTETYKEYNFSLDNNFNFSLTELINTIKEALSVNITFDFESFFNSYAIPAHGKLFDKTVYKTILFENVYYKNKSFYEADGSFFDISFIADDIEYHEYNKIKSPIDLDNAIQVTEPTLFLDYIYDFYNFGEFWDVVKRLNYLDKPQHMELYGLKANRILEIEKYFSSYGITYPPKYSRDYKWTDVTADSNKGSTFFFKELYFSVITNTARSTVDPWFAYDINKKFNFSKIEDKKYNLYLSRGNMCRGIVNEDQLVDSLTKHFDFKILNGNESLQEQMYYFTNAKLIFGAHGSLMCNTIWCKSNPIFVELVPPTKCMQLSFFDDTMSLGFKSIIVPCDGNEEQKIILTEKNIIQLMELLNILMH